MATVATRGQAEALGMVETKGYIAAVASTDAMLNPCRPGTDWERICMHICAWRCGLGSCCG
jgi:hypothetical protein